MVANAQRFTVPLDDQDLQPLLVERVVAAKSAVLSPQMITGAFTESMRTSVSHLTLRSPTNDNDIRYAELCRRIQSNPQWKAANVQAELVAAKSDHEAVAPSLAQGRPLVAEPRPERIKKTGIELKILHDYIAKAGMTVAQAKDFLSFVTEKQVEKFLAQDAVKTDAAPQLADDAEPGLNVLALSEYQKKIGDLLPDAKIKAHPVMQGEAKVRPLHPQMAAFGDNLQQVALASPAATVKPVSHDAHVAKELDFIAKSTDHNLDPALARQALALQQPQKEEQTVAQAAPLGQAAGIPVAAGAAAPVASGSAIERPPGNDGEALDVVKEAKKQQIKGLLRDNEKVYSSPYSVVVGGYAMNIKRRTDEVKLEQDLEQHKDATMADVRKNAHGFVKDLEEKNVTGLKRQVDTFANFTDEKKVVLKDYWGTVRHVGQANNQTRIISIAEQAKINKGDALFQINNTRRLPGLSATAA